MQQYYTLREAAEKLKMDPERLKEMAKANKLRALKDGATLRFRTEEIDEMARSLGHGSDPDLQLGELLPPKPAKPAASGKSPTPTSRRTMHVPADADMSLVGDEHERVPIGEESPSHRGGPKTPGASKSKPPSSKNKSGKSPAPAAGSDSDSDVRLVADGSDLDFQIAGEDSGKKKDPASGPKTPKDAKKQASKVGKDKPDSGARLIPPDKASDSDVKIVPDDRADDANVVLGGAKAKTASDSDVRLEKASGPGKNRGGSSDPFVTEEIELDLEAMKAEESKAKKKTRPSKAELPTTSPFELAEDDVPGPAKTSKGSRTHKDEESDSSSDFELAAHDDEVGLGEIGAKGGQASGIDFRDPKDSGISLEESGSDELEFVADESAGSTPKPKAGAPESSNEFEFSLDEGSPVAEEGTSSSEFELSLDEGAGVDSSSEFELSLEGAGEEASSDLEEEGADSDSEFELSLDPGGDLQSEDDVGLSEEKDIFETDFEVPALEEESGSEAVALDEGDDTDLEEESDFELDLSDEDLAAEESGSEAVALEEEEGEADEEAKPSRKPRKKAAAETEDFDEPLIDLEDMEGEEEEEPVAVGAGAPAPAAPWGVVPALFLTPSFLVLTFVVMMSFELMHNEWGYHTGGIGARLIINPLAKQIDPSVP